jgi:calcineurin-like phosphoesterase family protein
MSILLVQLSDLHLKTGQEPIVKRWDALCRAVDSEIQSDCKACVIVFSGDAAYGGKAEQFASAMGLLDGLRTHLAFEHPELTIHILTVPGNHDCDLTSEDSGARLKLRTDLTSKRPPDSFARVLLEPQKEYFTFAQQVGGTESALTLNAPYYKHFDLIGEEPSLSSCTCGRLNRPAQATVKGR